MNWLQVYLYEQTILRALEDVENRLARYRAAEERLRHITERQIAAERAWRIAKTQYDAGLIGALEAIDAERTVVEAARETIAAATEHRLAVVSINKALGRGWEDQTLLATNCSSMTMRFFAGFIACAIKTTVRATRAAILGKSIAEMLASPV